MQDKDISEEENKKIEIAALSLKTAMKGAGLFFLDFSVFKIDSYLKP